MYLSLSHFSHFFIFSVVLGLICRPFCLPDVYITKSAATPCLHTGIEQSHLLHLTARQGGQYYLVLYHSAPLLTLVVSGCSSRNIQF
jgi:hypothetical protein